MHSITLCITFCFLLATSALDKRAIKCREVVIPVVITANNAQVPAGGLSVVTSLVGTLVNTLFSATVQGSYNIAGRYCEPLYDVPSRRTTLQILSHPATYDRNFWSGGAYPGRGFDGERYDWVMFAARQGYPTLALDRLGNGNSSHPNPITIVQCPAEAEAIHEVINRVRAGTAPFPRAFKKVIYVGSSMGSIVGNVLNANHPDDLDATILTGFTKAWVNVVPGFITTAALLPAPGLDVGYLKAQNQAGAEFLLFFGRDQYYSGAFVDRDYGNRGTITIGEGVSGSLGILTAAQYKGSVLVVTGQQDVVFCGTTGSPVSGPGDCGPLATGRLAQTKVLYPVADYSWYAVANSGHLWEHQYSSQEGFKYSHDWLVRRKF